MSRLLAMVLTLFWVTGSFAQELSGLARVNASDSRLSDGWRGAAELTLSLSQGVPWRLFHLDDPRRLVLDFREIDWTGFDVSALGQAEAVEAVRVGGFRPGWSRMVLDLAAPVLVTLAFISAMVTAWDILTQSMMQRSVGDGLRGRAMGAWVFAIGAAPLGHLEIGFLAAAFGVQAALTLNGVAVVTIIAAALVAVPALRRL